MHYYNKKNTEYYFLYENNSNYVGTRIFILFLVTVVRGRY